MDFGSIQALLGSHRMGKVRLLFRTLAKTDPIVPGKYWKIEPI
jgi:hypothetical protein